MAGALEFIKKYGDVSFDELPFCDGDNAALCNMFYMPIETAVTHGDDVPPYDFSYVCNEKFAANGSKHRAVGLVLTRGISVLMMAMAQSKRYGEVKITCLESVFDSDPAVQYGAATLILPDGTLVILFRGTDDTFIGWIEDLDIYTKKGIPSHKLAVNYINKIAAKYDGDIIICGHSKGGNVALYGALNCNAEAKARIKNVYNNDGPGFYSFDYINSAAYRELLPKYKHYVPNSSLVGILLAHDDDYTVVKSSRLLGPMQHDIATWQLNGTEFVKKDDLTLLGKVADLSLMNLLMRITDEQSVSVEKVLNAIVDGIGRDGLLDFALNALPSLKGAVKAWKAVDLETKQIFKSAFNNTGYYVKAAVKAAKEGAVPAACKRAADLAAVLMA